MTVSVVVPVLNEVVRLSHCIEALSRVDGVDEIVVVDGGSTDGTQQRAHAFRDQSGLRLVCAPSGRAVQMNAGARAATGDALLFLHADCRLPEDAISWVRRTLALPGVVAGAFRTWTVDDRDPPARAPWLHLADLRSRYTRLPYGDQALFLGRETFQRVGGFPEMPLMEDLEMSIRLSRLGRIARVPARVTVSGRRFLAHPVRDTLWVNLFPLLYRLGVSPERLARLYEDVR